MSFYSLLAVVTASWVFLKADFRGMTPVRSTSTVAINNPLTPIDADKPKDCYTGKRTNGAIYMRHFRDFVVRRTLKALHPQIPFTSNAECLVMETIAHESGLGTYLNDTPDAPSRGIAQIEEPTFRWLKRLSASRYSSVGTKLHQLFGNPEHDQLSVRMDLSVAFCRFRYFIVKEPIPDSVEERASYWARYYQTTNDPQKIQNYISNARKYL